MLGHGSRRGKDTDLGLEEIRHRLQRRFDNGQKVRMAGLEFTPPSLEEAVLGLAREGSENVLIMPLFLFWGKHLKEEVPRDLERIKSLAPQVSLMLSRSLGLDPRLVDMVEERIKSALPKIRVGKNNGKKSAGAVLVRRGSRPEYDNGEELFKLAEAVSERLDLPVEPAQAQFGQPAISEAIRSLLKPGIDTVIVMPYLLFPGKVLYDNIMVEVDHAAALYPRTTFLLTPTLGVDDRLVDIAVDRIREVVSC